MAESTLSLGFPELLQRVGNLLGWPWDTSTWTADQLAKGGHIVNDGYRRFLTCMPLGGDPVAHRWTFFEKTGTLSVTVADPDFNYDLPDDFAAFATPIRFSTAACGYLPLEQTNEGWIAERRALSTQSGTPTKFALRCKESAGTAGQRWEVLIWPNADATHALEYRYEVLSYSLTTGRPYPLGGMQHADTILEFALAAAESFAERPGLHTQQQIQRLAASISADTRVMTLDTVGMMHDPSVEGDKSFQRNMTLKYNGTPI
jgi:hypothetical protein